jgi:[protein-PII] uridylyltransferase
MPLERGPLLADDSLTGAAWCRAHSDLIDAWLADLLNSALRGGSTEGLALVAVGGYGRSELCPQSDIDVMLVHNKRSDVSAIADRLWYPVWDAGLHLGHSVCTVREAAGLAADDLDTATALLSARHVAGDARVAADLAESGQAQWQRKAKKWLTELAARVDLRHEKVGEVAFRLEPDLKEGRGGLRDVHALVWLEAARRVLLDDDHAMTTTAYGTLLDARVELQRHTGRPSNLLALQDQDAVAKALGLADADVLMAGIAEAARTIAWTSDDAWRRVRLMTRGPLGRVARRTRQLEDGIAIRDGELHIDPGVHAHADMVVALRAAVGAAQHETVIDRESLELLAKGTESMPDPWPAGVAPMFIDLLATGRHAIRVIEALDQRGVWARILPEWSAVRARPQRNAYHRFTVDRHLLETAANAARLATRVKRPDLLVLGALIHDIGKGHPGDHTEVGQDLAARIVKRMGYPDEDVATLVAMVEHHLLLPDVATRRDLDDPTTLDRVAAAVGTIDRLQLLAALTEADSLATGPAAWGPWKAELIGQLVERVAHVLEGVDTGDVIGAQFPTEEQLARLDDGGQHIEVNDDMLTVMATDRPGLFSRVAGVLALHGLDVMRAAAYSSDDGRAMNEFRVSDPVRSEIPWSRVLADLELALAGRLALHARIAERVRTYSRSRSLTRIIPATVTFDDDASSLSTVIDVQAADGIGVLYRITRAIAELELDIRSAKVQTMGTQVVDSFYVRDSAGHRRWEGSQPAWRAEVRPSLALTERSTSTGKKSRMVAWRQDMNDSRTTDSMAAAATRPSAALATRRTTIAIWSSSVWRTSVELLTTRTMDDPEALREGDNLGISMGRSVFVCSLPVVHPLFMSPRRIVR